MAEKAHKDQQYGYANNSNLVLQADRSALPRRNQEPSGEPESLWGRIDPRAMGDRTASTFKERKEKAEKRRKQDAEKSRSITAKTDLALSAARQRQRRERESVSRGMGYTSVLAATEDMEGVSYIPRTKETRQVYSLILSFLSKYLGDIQQDVLRSAAESVLDILKDDSKKDHDRKKEVEELINVVSMPSEEFAQLVNLGKKVTDYGDSDDAQIAADDGTNRDIQMDEEHGVAVVFDEDEEQEQDLSEDELEVDEDDEDDEEDAPGAADAAADGETAAADVIQLRSGENKKREEGSDAEDDEEDDFTTVVRTGKAAQKAVYATNDHVDPHKIDAFWLQRAVAQHYSDALSAQAKAVAAMDILASSADARDVENDLMGLFDYEKFDLVRLLTRNRDAIVWCTKLARADSDDERQQIEQEMRERDLSHILDELRSAPGRNRGVAPGGMVGDDNPSAESAEMDVDGEPKQPDARMRNHFAEEITPNSAPRTTIDLDAIAFDQGGHLMSNRKCKLPEGSFKRSKKGYEEVHVPAPKPKPIGANEKLIDVSQLPEWVQPAFPKTKTLNRVQSKVYPIAFGSDENMLLCAPTGVGKTNCAMLTIMREIGKYRDEASGSIDLDGFKIVYVAPMKALVAEVVGNFSSRLKEAYGINVAELTGDRQLTKQQISETQIIVTTPEKWDIITRKSTDRSYTNLVRLIIIDEIHLLHDERGPVLESIVARTLRQVQQTQDPVRLVGLSATLPNYADVAAFMRVNPDSGLFFFDGSYRPCPLKQQYMGITEKKAIKRLALMNEIVYERVLEDAAKNNQVLVFCHSRKETAKTAKAIRDMAMTNETIGNIIPQDSASREILKTEAENSKNEDLSDLLPYGFAIHHAGMTRVDRQLVEDLFSDGHVKVLVSTATLAWGVNLPAHTVIIKGTQVYSPEKGRWVELSPQDMLQMLGRAGRPQFDTFGEGVIITTHSELQYYLSLLNQQLPIESQMASRLPDTLNAEIVMGNIRDRADAVDWFSYTYMYIRMLRSGSLYGVSSEDLEEDPLLIQRRIDLVHAAANVLDKCNLVKYDRKTGKIQTTELGRIASYYYISHKSMATYNQHLRSTMTLIDLFRIFALSNEFRLIPVREEEKLELAKLLERVPIPVKESIEEPTAKINVLLQSYISQLKLEGFALMSDMVYVTQSAGRILRAIFEMCLKRGWAALARKALDLCKMVDKRIWLSMSPLRQIRGFPPDIARRLERKDYSWDRYFDLKPNDLGDLAGMPKAGKTIHKYVHQIPKLDLQVHVQPITRSLLRFELTITPNFLYDEKVHGSAESFWVLVEDVDAEHILYHEVFLLKQRYSEQDHTISFTVPLYDPPPPNYFVSVISDRWLHSETHLAVSFKHLLLPEKYPPHTDLLDLQPLPPSALRNKKFEAMYAGVKYFNPIQTQVFPAVYQSDDNVFVGAPVGSGKTVCAEFALLRMWSQSPRARCVYIAPFEEVVEMRMSDWRSKFGDFLGGKNLVSLTGETAADLKLLETGDIIFSTPQRWDMLSRRWKQRKNVQTVGLFIVDDIHLIGSEIGPVIEVITSRMRYVSMQTDNKIRIVALGVSLANARDLGEWIGATPQTIFNFHPSVRPVPLEIHIQGYSIPHFPSLMLAMGKPTYQAITTMSRDQPAIVFVPSRKQSRLTAVEMLSFCIADGDENRFLRCSDDDIRPYLSRVADRTLRETLEHGVAFYHEVLSASDQRIVESLFDMGAIQVMVASRDVCWKLRSKCHLVVIMGAQYYEGKEHRYVDYPVTDVLQMIGRASQMSSGDVGRCVLMCQTTKKDFYKKFLYDALPVESHLDHFLHDHFNAEIVTKTIETKQDAVDYLTWTFFYRRMALNPNYYNLQGVTHRHLSDHLSDLVETTLDDLSKSGCISIDEDDSVSPLNLGMIAAYYYVNYVTIESYSLSLQPKTKIRGILDIISAASEYDDVPIRHHEDTVIRYIYDRLPVKMNAPDFNDPHTKTHVLLQSYFSRVQLPPDLECDQKRVMERIMRLVQSCVDVVSSNGWLAPALAAMEVMQMSIQAVWDRDSPLKQVPHLTSAIMDRLQSRNVETVLDILDLNPDEQIAMFEGLSNRQMEDVTAFVNRYPTIDVNFKIQSSHVSRNDVATVHVVLERDLGSDDDEDDAVDIGSVIAPFYPGKKDEGWYVVIGDASTKALYAIKRTTLQKRVTVKLEFTVPESVPVGNANWKLYVMCDAYVGVDQEFDLELEITDDMDNDDDEEQEADA